LILDLLHSLFTHGMEIFSCFKNKPHALRALLFYPLEIASHIYLVDIHSNSRNPTTTGGIKKKHAANLFSTKGTLVAAHNEPLISLCSHR
jgi:hypothetical protein